MDPVLLGMMSAPRFYPTHGSKRANFWRLEHLDHLGKGGRLHPSLKQLWEVKGGNGLKVKARKFREKNVPRIPQKPQPMGRELALLFLTDSRGAAVYMIDSPQGWTLPGGTVDAYCDHTLFQSVKRHWTTQTNAGLPEIRFLLRERLRKKIFGNTVYIFFGCLDYGQPLPTTPITP